MKKSRKRNSNQTALKKSLKLSVAVSALGLSLGVNAGNLYAAALDLEAVTLLPAVQSKLENTQLKYVIPQLDQDIATIDSSQLKYDATFLKIDSIQDKWDVAGLGLSNYKENVFSEDLSTFEQNYPELYIFPPGISSDNPFNIPNPLDPNGNPTGLNFLTFGVESFTYDVNADGSYSITGVQSVPEPSSMLMLGSGIAGLIVLRKLRKGRV